MPQELQLGWVWLFVLSQRPEPGQAFHLLKPLLPWPNRLWRCCLQREFRKQFRLIGKGGEIFVRIWKPARKHLKPTHPNVEFRTHGSETRAIGISRPISRVHHRGHVFGELRRIFCLYRDLFADAQALAYPLQFRRYNHAPIPFCRGI